MINCPICQDTISICNINNIIIIAPCGHIFCDRCWHSFIKYNVSKSIFITCPYCRKDVMSTIDIESMPFLLNAITEDYNKEILELKTTLSTISQYSRKSLVKWKHLFCEYSKLIGDSVVNEEIERDLVVRDQRSSYYDLKRSYENFMKFIQNTSDTFKSLITKNKRSYIPPAYRRLVL